MFVVFYVSNSKRSDHCLDGLAACTSFVFEAAGEYCCYKILHCSFIFVHEFRFV